MDRSELKHLLKAFEQSEPGEKLLFSKVLNQASLCKKSHINCFTDFFDPARANRFTAVLRSEKNLDCNMITFGGYPSAERLMIGFAPSYIDIAPEDCPIAVIKMVYDARFTATLSHRDFLGSILGLGLDRGKIGDILMREGQAFIFAERAMASYIAVHLEKVGHSKVRSALCEPAEALRAAEAGTAEATATTVIVASLRVDTMIGHIFNLSRGKAAEAIAAEKVFVNWQPVKSAAKTVAPGDTVTLRGTGRAKIGEITGKSKKDRWIVQVLRFG